MPYTQGCRDTSTVRGLLLLVSMLGLLVGVVGCSDDDDDDVRITRMVEKVGLQALLAVKLRSAISRTRCRDDLPPYFYNKNS
jgi:hypothetical protein